MPASPPTDNARGAKRAKIQLRQRVLQAVRPSSVFDAFCGCGAMWAAAWRDADNYIGCDSREFCLTEQHRRYVADNRMVMRCIDLHAYNIFDFDAYGSPWDQMLILSKLRRWTPGELGAIVLTDGSSMTTMYGSLSRSMSIMLGLGRNDLPRTVHTGATLQRMLLSKWAASSRVTPLQQWAATGKGSGRGGQTMTYTALVFRGL